MDGLAVFDMKVQLNKFGCHDYSPKILHVVPIYSIYVIWAPLAR